jgi:acyl-CoA reductase-like NAD-dependent aldehyde dehydrogenase
MRMMIAGEWTTGGRQEELRSPYNHEVIETVPLADVGDVDRAIAAAVRGAKHQRRLAAYEREAILRRAGDIADARVDDLARTISAETGKPISEAKGEASRVGDLLRLSGFEGSQLYGESLPLDAAPNGGTGTHRAEAVRDISRGGPACPSHLVSHRLRRGSGRRAVRRSSRPQGQLHREFADR